MHNSASVHRPSSADTLTTAITANRETQMTAGHFGRANVGGHSFAAARVAAENAESVQRLQATRTVAGNAMDANDCQELLAILGLSGVDAEAR